VIFLYSLHFISTGDGRVGKDLVEAGKPFTELAEQGHPFAQVKFINL